MAVETKSRLQRKKNILRDSINYETHVKSIFWFRFPLTFYSNCSCFCFQIYTAISIMFIVWFMILKTVEFLPATQTEMWEKKNTNANVLFAITLLQAFPLGFFILEFTLRLVVCPRKSHFMFALINILDLVSILSIVTDLAVGSNPMEVTSVSDRLLYMIVRIFWVCRCFRLIWFLRMCSFSLAFTYAVKKGWMNFLALFISFCFAGLLFTSYLFASEGTYTYNDTEILDALWWSFITVTTVGYGDIYPITLFGKLSAVLCYFTRFLPPYFLPNLLNIKLLVDTQNQNTLPENVVKLAVNFMMRIHHFSRFD